MNLNANLYSWVITNEASNTRVECAAEMVSVSRVRFTPSSSVVFNDTAANVWALQLLDKTTNTFGSRRTFLIPARPKPITVSQRAPQFPINGNTYHLPNTNSKYAMLDINDPDYYLYHRLPYKIVANGEEIATINSIGGASYDDLGQGAKDTLNAQFEREFNEWQNFDSYFDVYFEMYYTRNYNNLNVQRNQYVNNLWQQVTRNTSTSSSYDNSYAFATNNSEPYTSSYDYCAAYYSYTYSYDTHIAYHYIVFTGSTTTYTYYTYTYSGTVWKSPYQLLETLKAMFKSAYKVLYKAEYKALYKEKWLAQQLGTRVISNSIKLNERQNLQLVDANGCVYDFSVLVTAPAPAAMSASENPQSRGLRSIAKPYTITYNGGGPAPFVCAEGTLAKAGDKIIVQTSGCGDHKVFFTDTLGNPSFVYTIRASGNAVATVAHHQTTPAPNGSISVSVSGFAGSKTYELQNVAYPFTTYTKTSSNDTCSFTGLPAGHYKVKASQNDCFLENEAGYEVKHQLLSFKSIVSANATTLAGTGSIGIILNSYGNNTTCFINSTSYPIASGTIIANNLPAGQYAIRTESDGYVLRDTVTIAQPDFWGTITINYAEGLCRINTNEAYGNALFNDYVFRIKNDSGDVAAQGKTLNVTLPNFAGGYGEAYNPHIGDSATVCSIPQIGNMAYQLSITQPSCPYDSGVVAITPKSGSFANETSNVNVSYDGGFSYGGQWRMAFAPSPLGKTEFSAVLCDRKTEVNGNLTIEYAYEQPIDTFFTTPEEVYAQPRRRHVSCSGLSDGQIWLENLYGGSGEYRYKVNNGAWRNGTDTIADLPPGIYAVYLQDSKCLCTAIELDSLSIGEPTPRTVDSMLFISPICDTNSGGAGALFGGGSGGYTASWYRNGELLKVDEGADTMMVNDRFFSMAGDSLWQGVYRVTVADFNGCTASDEVTLPAYLLPQLDSILAVRPDCSERNGRLTVAPLDTASAYRYLWSTGDTTPVLKNLAQGLYQLTITDSLGCASHHEVELKCADATFISEQKAASLTVFPNPVSNEELIVKNEELQAGDKIEVYSLSGARLKIFAATGARSSIDLSSLPAGTYMVKAGGAVAKVVKK
jgi:hypothetical protein